MDLSAYTIPATGISYDYNDDGLGGLADDGLGVGYAPPQPSNPTELTDYLDDFYVSDMPAAAAPDASQPADEAPDSQKDLDLEAALDEELFKTTGDASKSQQADEDSEMTVDDATAYSDGEAAVSREGSQQPEDPAHVEEQKLNAWKQECYDAMTEAQRNRLEAYNRSNLQKKTMKKVLQELTGSAAANDRVLHALGSVTKMFVGELVATARQIAACQGHSGALLPSHVRAAYQVLSEGGKVPRRGPNKPLRLR